MLQRGDMFLMNKPGLPYRLSALHELTRHDIDKAIDSVSLNHPGILKYIDKEKILKKPYEKLLYSSFSAWKCLATLINPDIQGSKSLRAGLMILAELLFDKEFSFERDLMSLSDDYLFLKNDDAVVRAARIFVQFKLLGGHYVSLNKRGGGCLHDALYCDEYSEDLTRLLVKNSANHNKENDEHLTALSLGLLANYGDAFEDLLRDRTQQSVRKIFYVMACIMGSAEYNPWPCLKLVALYDLYGKYSDLLNSKSNLNEFNDSILHLAVFNHSSEVVYYLLCKGANLEALNFDKCKPVHVAVERAMLANKDDYFELDASFKVIAYLLWATLNREFCGDTLQAQDVVDALFKLDLTKKDYREKVCEALFSLEHQPGFVFSLEELINLLARKRSDLHQENIDCSLGDNAKIGEGGFSVVYKGRYHDDTKALPVAIKMYEKMSGNHYMHLEAEKHSRLLHPNILQYYGTLERHGYFGIIMQYANNHTLEHFMLTQEKPVIAYYFFSFANQMLAGLEYLHNQNYVHLDFKLTNILLYNDTLLLSDFGSLGIVGERSSSNVTTCTHCAPERFNPENPYHCANDIFGFGVVIAELAAKRHAWPSPVDEKSVQEKICAGERADFNDVKIIPSLAKLVRWCWEQDLQKRPDCVQIKNYLAEKFHSKSNMK